MDDNERKRVKKFLDQFAAEIDYALSDGHAHWFPPGVLERLQPAWKQLKPRIPEIKAEIDDPQNQSRLDEEGFSGVQLSAKTAAWESRTRPSAWRSALGWLRPFQGALKIANGILESLGRVIPAVGALDEFKKILEGALDIGDGRGPIKKAVSWIRRRRRSATRPRR